MAKVVEISKSLTAPEKEGVHYRLLCLTGKNKGTSYYLKGNRAVMGRGEDADVQVLDVKSSRAHAELTKVGKHYVVTDLGSQNGIVVNDLKVSQHQLIDADKIIIGQTVFKFSVLINKTREELKQLDESDEDENKSKKGKKKNTNSREKKSKKRLWGMLGVLAILWVVLDGSNEESKANKKKPDTEDMTAALALNYGAHEKIDDIDTRNKVKVFIHRGQREYREGNFFRAIEQLNLCLILAPNHGYCSFLLNKSKQRLDEMIKLYFNKAKIDVDSLKYRAALVEYCSVVRLLGAYKEAGKSDVRLEDAEKNIEYVEKKLGMEPGEYSCI